ncbi:MAG: AI-2E family transporter [Oscillochloris sp.]|nr:AI-2E family transporter [Oscillochloris sp.]
MQQTARDYDAPVRVAPAGGLRTLGRQALIIAGVSLLLVALFLFFRAILDVLMVIFAGILLAILLRSLANPIAARTPLGQRTSLAIVVIILLGAIILGGWLFVPALAEQTDRLTMEIPSAFQQSRNWLAQYGWGRWVLDQVQNPTDLVTSSSLIGNVRGIFSNTLTAVIGVLVFLFLGLYLAIEPGIYQAGLLRLIPPTQRDRGREVLMTLGQTLQWWLLSKFIAMIVIGVLTTIGLSLLGVPLALALGIIAALLSFIPNLGPTLATVPAVLIALNQSPAMAVQVLVLYIAIQALESYVITPYIERKALILPPALTLAIQIALAVLIGSLGVFLAAPLVVAGIVLVRMLYIEDILGDRTAEA